VTLSPRQSAMAMLRIAMCLPLLAGAVESRTAPTAMEQVVIMLQGIHQEVVNDAAAEAVTYQTFADFCKTTTASKSGEIATSKDAVDTESSNLEMADAENNRLLAAYKVLVKEGEEAAKTLADGIAKCNKDKDAKNAAIAAASTAAHAFAQAELSLKTNNDGIASANALIQMHQEPTTPAPEVAADGSKTKQDYGFKSLEILKLLKSMKEQSDTKEATLRTELNDLTTACSNAKTANENAVANNNQAKQDNEDDRRDQTQERGRARTALVGHQTDMKEQALFMKDLTASCEARAKDWDQRSAARNGEKTALEAAMNALGGATAAEATSAQRRQDRQDEEEARLAALPGADMSMMESKASIKKSVAAVSDSYVMPPTQAPADDSMPTTDAPADDSMPTTDAPTEDTDATNPSFLQVSSQRGLRGYTDGQRVQHALAALQIRGRKIGSLAISSLTVRASAFKASPFKKIKKLIDNMVIRLTEEAAAESSKKGYCDTELAKVKHTQDHQFSKVSHISSDVEGLESTRDTLVNVIAKTQEEIAANILTSQTADTAREKLRRENAQGVKTAKEGSAAVKKAIGVLNEYYSKAAKASFLQASPVGGPAAEKGSYGGKQDASKNVVGLLETIKSDFDRVARNTAKAEKEAKKEHHETSTALLADTKGKQTKLRLDQEDLETTNIGIEKGLIELQKNQNLLDAAVENHLLLKPTCVDTGMTYSERVAKRNDEITALKIALCQLDAEGVESNCDNGVPTVSGPDF